jgi:hypothetical protein
MLVSDWGSGNLITQTVQYELECILQQDHDSCMDIHRVYMDTRSPETLPREELLLCVMDVIYFGFKYISVKTIA